MTDLTVHQAISRVMEDVRAVRKSERNSQQGFMFRGVDNVVNAVGPALRTHGVIVVPNADTCHIEGFQTAKGAQMYRAVVKVTYTFYGPAGDSLTATVMGEGSDSLDKATSKAMSVAYRTCLLQTLALPTDEPDPDSFNPPAMLKGEPTTKTKLTQAKAKVWQAAQAHGWDKAALEEAYLNGMGAPIGQASVADLEAYLKTIVLAGDSDG